VAVAKRRAGQRHAMLLPHYTPPSYAFWKMSGPRIVFFTDL
jgi:hypothetical protein